VEPNPSTQAEDVLLPVPEMVQDSARPGTICVEPGTNSTRVLKMGRPAFMPVVVVTICGFKGLGIALGAEDEGL
jgi:hypothetical protein